MNNTISNTTTSLAECLVLVAPDWFARDDFLDWRQGRHPEQWSAPAIWNRDKRTDDYADVFVVFDRRWTDHAILEPGTEHCWECSDPEGLPGDIYDAIGRVLLERGLRHGIVWIKPA